MNKHTKLTAMAFAIFLTSTASFSYAKSYEGHQVHPGLHCTTDLINGQVVFSAQDSLTLQDAINLNRSKKYAEAYKISSKLTATTGEDLNNLVQVQVESLLFIDQKKAVEMVKKRLVENDYDYGFLSNIAADIAETQTLDKATYLYGATLFTKLLEGTQETPGGFLIIYDLGGRCYYRGGEVSKAIDYAEKSLADAKAANSAPETITYLEGVLQAYKAGTYGKN